MNPQHNPHWGPNNAYNAQSLADINMHGLSLAGYGQQQQPNMGMFPQSQGNINTVNINGDNLYRGNSFGGIIQGGKNLQGLSYAQQTPSFSIDSNQFKPYENQ